MAVAPVITRNLKDEAPRGYSWPQALDLLCQGYTIEHVATRTGFPAPMLRANFEPELAPRPVVPKVPVHVPVASRVVVKDELEPLRARGELSEEAMAYVFTDHAVERTLERKIRYVDVLRLIDAKDKIVTRDHKFRRGWMHTERFRYIRENLSIVVVPAQRVVVTVSWRNED